eukprot:2664787-Prymnesium_polylepis.1
MAAPRPTNASSRLAVLARHDEDIGWLVRAPMPCLVVTNLLPHEGRDASAYLWFIVTRYEALP